MKHKTGRSECIRIRCGRFFPDCTASQKSSGRGCFPPARFPYGTVISFAFLLDILQGRVVALTGADLDDLCYIIYEDLAVADMAGI